MKTKVLEILALGSGFWTGTLLFCFALRFGLLKERLNVSGNRVRPAFLVVEGILLCFWWFDLITPRFGGSFGWSYGINAKVVLAWLVGWVIILGTMFCLFCLLNLSKKKKK